MITSWRIVKSEYAGTAFDGKSASIAGGRWNSRGTALVYTAASASLCALELLVHLTRAAELHDYVLFACSYSEELVETVDRKTLPSDWKKMPAPAALKIIGDAWVGRASSAVLRVPSVIIETEFNYLLNTAHSAFGKIEIAEPAPFSLDMRLMRKE